MCVHDRKFFFIISRFGWSVIASMIWSQSILPSDCIERGCFTTGMHMDDGRGYQLIR